MKPISPLLLQKLSDNFQIDNKAPNAAVYFHHKDTGERLRGPRVLSIDIERRVDMFAAEFEIVLDNTWGWLTPYYDYDKFPFILNDVDRGDPQHNPWGSDVIYPNRKVEIFLGYGDELLRNMTGLIDRFVISAEDKTITLTGRDMYKHLIEETIKEPKSWENTPAKDIIVELVEDLGLSIEADEVLELGTEETYIVPSFSTQRAYSVDRYVDELLETTFSNIHCQADGTLELYNVPDLDQFDPEDYVLDEFINLTEAEYNTEDFDIFTNLIIEGPEGEKKAYEDSTLKNTLCLGQFREDIVRVPWADTDNKKKQAALSKFRRMKQSLYAITVGTVGNPALELYDIARIREHVTTTSMKYLTQSIRTTYDDDGYFDLIDLEVIN